MTEHNAGRASIRSQRLPLGYWRTLTTGLAVAGATVLLVTLVAAAGSHRLGFDFRAAYLPAAEAVREGDSPYVRDRPVADAEWHPYLYPPQLAIALIPATALSVDTASFLAFLVSVAAVITAIALCGVRDIRCFAIAIAWAPTWHALEMANVSAILALGLAVAWRYRNATRTIGVVLGVAISVKLFLWPLLAWTAATRRYSATGLALVAGAGITFLAWAAIGFAGLTAYPGLRSALGNEASYSIVAVAEAWGYPQSVGRAVAALVGGSLLGLAFHFGRRRDDLCAFTSAVAAALALTPSLWQHYLVLLVVPLAAARPRFSSLWLLPIALWMSPRAGNGDGFETLLPLLVAAFFFTVILARPVRMRSVAEVTA